MSASSKILCVGMGWFPEQAGGLNRYVYGLSRQLASQTSAIELCYSYLQQPSKDPLVRLTPLVDSDAPLLKRLWTARQAFHQHQLQSPEAVNLHFSLYSWPLLSQLPQKAPITFTFHGPWAKESQREGASPIKVAFAKWLEQRVYNRCDRFITLSQAFADILHQDYNIPKNKIHIIPGGINTDKFKANLTRLQAREQLNFPQDRPILFCPRRLVQRMGIDKLIEALVTVKQQHPNIWLAIAGKGPQQHALKQQVQKLGLTDNITFLGYVPDEDLPICYQAADLTVVPSQALEGFGLILLESLSSGTPVLSTPVGGMPEVLGPFDRNLLTEAISAEAISQRLLQFLNKELSLPSREACRNYVVDNFDWRIIAPRVKNILLMPKSQ